MSLKYMFVFLAASVVYTVAITPEEKEKLKETVGPVVMECAKEYEITKEDLQAAAKAESTDNVNSCFFRCFFKKFGVINDQGLFDVEEVQARAKKFTNNEKYLNKVSEIGQACSSVNDEPVSDGNEGCERSKLLVDCIIKNKGDLTPFE